MTPRTLFIYPPTGAAIEANLWDRNAYRFDTRRADLDKAASGITFAQDGDDILITVAAGTAAHALPSDGAYLVWEHRSSLSGKQVNFETTSGLQGVSHSHLAFLEGLGDGQSIEVLTGRINDTSLTQQGTYAGMVDATDPTCVAVRQLSSAMVRNIDASPSGNLLSVFQDDTKNSSNAGVTTNRNMCIGMGGIDPRNAVPTPSPFDVAEGAGGLSMRNLVCLNVRNASGVATATEVTYRVRLRVLAIDWGV